MKKVITVILAMILLTSFTSCNAPVKPVVISPEEFAVLDDTYMESLNVGMILSDPWQDANEIEPELFMYYYASIALRKEAGIEDGWKDGFLIPEVELETAMRKHFNVSTEHLRTNEYYLAAEHGYEFGGLGSASDTVVTNAVLTGNMLSLDYDVNGPMDYVLARGTVEMEVTGGDMFSEDFKLLSNQIEWTAQYHLAFPSAMDEVDNRNIFMMDSGGQSGRGPSRDERTWYDGENLTSIIRFYEDEALPALEAEGHADTSIHEDGWYWSGTYRGGTPLTIDVQPKYGAATYVISVLYDESSDPGIAENMRERDFMQPPNINDFTELVTDYVWPLFSAGVLDTTWSTGENVEIPALVALYANSLNSEDREDPESSFPASYIENYAGRFFDIDTNRMHGHTTYNAEDSSYTYMPLERTEHIAVVSALTYGREYEDGDDSPIRIVIAYEVTPSEEDNTVLWSGELELELSSGGYKYLSNKQITALPTTDQMELTVDNSEISMYLDDIQTAYLSILYRQNWANPSEISPDSLCNFYNYGILYKENNPSGWEGEKEIFQTDVMNGLTRYFENISEVKLTDAASYDPQKDIFRFTAGFGGAAAPRITNSQRTNDVITIYYDSFVGDEKNGEGIVRIREEANSFYYLSNEFVDHYN